MLSSSYAYLLFLGDNRHVHMSHGHVAESCRHQLACICRLCFDARGDLDSRQPYNSCAAVVVDKPEHNYHPGGMMQPKLRDLVQTAEAEAGELWTNNRRHAKVILPAA